MPNEELIQYSQLRSENIDPNQFTLSLLKEGLESGALTALQVKKIQAGIMKTLSGVILKFTSHESNSVPTHAAQGLMLSIVYNMDLYLKELGDLKSDLDALLNIDAAQLYERGMVLAQQDFEEAKQLLGQVKETRLPTLLAAYNDTIDNGFTDFFRAYDIKFDAQNTLASVDYPLLGDDMKPTGIVYVKRYLKCLAWENKLCAQFEWKDVRMLLDGYGQQYRCNYNVLLINIAEVVLKNAFCGMLAGKGGRVLHITQKECAAIEQRICSLTPEECRRILQGAAEELVLSLCSLDWEMKKYIRECVDSFAAKLAEEASRGSVRRLIVIQETGGEEERLDYRPGPQLSGPNLRRLIGRLSACEDAKEKAALIRRKVQNAADLIEVFGAYCLAEQEYGVLWKAMSELELAVLLSEVLGLSPLHDVWEFSFKTDLDAGGQEGWRDDFMRFLEGEPEPKKQRIVQLEQAVRQGKREE